MINKRKILKKNYETTDEYVLETLQENIEDIYTVRGFNSRKYKKFI